MDQSNKKDDDIFNFLKRVYPNLKKWFNWFEGVQKYDNKHFYKWNSRYEGLVLGSGLDDYPRSDSKTVAKYFLDLQVSFFLQFFLIHVFFFFFTNF